MSIKRKMDGSPNSERLINNEYAGSKAMFTNHLVDSRDEIQVIVDNSGVKSGCDSESTDSSDDGDSKSSCMTFLEGVLGRIDLFYAEHKRVIRWMFYILLSIAYTTYFIWALVLDFNRAISLLIITGLVVVMVTYGFIRDTYGEVIHKKVFQPIEAFINKRWGVLRWFVYIGLLAGICIFLYESVGLRPKQYSSLGGLVFFFLILLIFSKHPTKVRWRPVLWGFGLNFLFAVLILKWSYGYKVFQLIGNEINQFLKYSDYGAEFVFGKKYTDHFFAFKILPVIVFFSCAISTLYHLGAMQAIISKFAWLMQITMSTSAAESLSCASNIFVGLAEAPILIRPFLDKMTKSELHAVMTGGFATIAGGVLAAYILFGISAEHLLCASVMNAPVALAVSKLFYPETEDFQIKSTEEVMVNEKKCNNLLEAASAGASSSIGLISNIVVNLIAFLAMLAFVNASLSWFGGMVDHPELSFELICSYIFMPVAFLMGVDWEDASIVGELLGTKTFLNEFVAYQELSKYINNRENCIRPYISPRSELITTYALCGFANISSIGIMIGGLSSMVPSRASDLANIVIRSLVSGTIACFITACVAAILIIEEPFDGCPLNATTNATMNSSLFSPDVPSIYSIAARMNNNLTITNLTNANV